MLMVSMALADESSGLTGNSSSSFGSGWGDWGNFGDFSGFGDFGDFPQMSGFGDNDWFANFNTPEGFGEVKDLESMFGTKVDGSDWGSTDNSTMDSWQSKFDTFKKDHQGNDDQTINNAEPDGLDKLRSSFDNTKVIAEAGPKNTNSGNVKDAFLSQFGTSVAYTEDLGMPGMPVTKEELDKTGSLKGAYDAMESTAVGNKASTINSATKSVEKNAKSVDSVNVSFNGLTDFSKTSAFKSPEKMDIKSQAQNWMNGTGNKISDSKVGETTQTGEKLVKTAKDKQPTDLLSKYKPITK